MPSPVVRICIIFFVPVEKDLMTERTIFGLLLFYSSSIKVTYENISVSVFFLNLNLMSYTSIYATPKTEKD